MGMRLLLRECGVLPQDAVLVALSGGLDSVVLLHALWNARKNGEIGELFAAHLHHGLRGEEADRDLAFCQDLCAFLAVPFHYARMDVRRKAEEEHLSVETAARSCRYAFLQETLERFGADHIAVAHHRDDQTETILLHLLRGSGLEGLCGMRLRNGNIIRPLLREPRSELVAYAKENRLSHCEDSTNGLDDVTRNRIRHQLIPMLRSFNPAIDERMDAMASLLSTDADHLAAETDAALMSATCSDGWNRRALLDTPPAIRSRVLKQLLLAAQCGDVEMRDVERLDALLYAQTGTEIELRGKQTAWIDSKLLHIGKPAESEPFCVPFCVNGNTQTPVGTVRSAFAAFRKPQHAFEAFLDADRIAEATVIRSRRDGDRFFPLGSSGLRKLSDVLTDRKIPRQRRNRLPLLCCENEVLWMPGYTVSEKVKVTPQTERILHIIFEEDNEDGRIETHG